MERARTDQAGAVEALIKQGVKFVACQNMMRRKSIRTDPAPGRRHHRVGGRQVVRKQQFEGFANFKS